jgi:hypothetical protein
MPQLSRPTLCGSRAGRRFLLGRIGTPAGAEYAFSVSGGRQGIGEMPEDMVRHLSGSAQV